uniref:Katanin p80 WD40 repeat-containing subunit B1 homolog n=1 Tax=Knipowitschia caucasica TaxID=637954 RepID=A0AAV2M3U3_KNICA
MGSGKVITEFKSHTGAVNTVQFHPSENLLASGSADRTVKLWNLVNFTMVGSLKGDTSAVRCVFFSPDGSCLYSGSSDTLRVFGWEPDRCFDVVSVGWSKVSDLSICNRQLIGASHQLSTVSTFVVDLTRVKRNGRDVLQDIILDDRLLSVPPRVKPFFDRRSPEGERRSPSEDEGDEKVSSAEIHNADDYKAIFQPRNVIPRRPPKFPEPFPAPPEDDSVLGISSKMKGIAPFAEKQQVSPIAQSTPVQRVEPTVVCAKRVPPPAEPPTAWPPPAPSAPSASQK